MLFSLALIVLCGFAAGAILQKLKMPPLLGMMLTGVLLGPYVLNLIHPSILSISAELRRIALVVILIRAGLSLDWKDLKKVGRPAALMCFIPATFELAAVTVFAPVFLGISHSEAAVLGAVLAAVSPAVVVPRMLRLMEDGYGQDQKIPQMILAGASLDDVYVIVLFTSLAGMQQGQSLDLLRLAEIPLSVLTGIMAGVLAGLIAVKFLKTLSMSDTVKTLMLFAVALLLCVLEDAWKGHVAFSGLLAVMALGGTIRKKNESEAGRFTAQYAKIWVPAELVLFVLVGAAVDIRSVRDAGAMAVCLVLVSLVFRMAGVFICLVKTELNRKERLFSAIAYLPKATVQAAIGGIPLSMGMAAGNTILTVAVLAILITAPVGAIGMDLTYKRWLTNRPGNN